MTEKTEGQGGKEGQGCKSVYTRLIQIAGWSFAFAVAVFSIYMLFEMLAEGASEKTAGSREPISVGKSKVIGGLAILPFGGYLLGTALAVLFVPTSYLKSIEGKQWMKMVGVKSVESARAVSFVVCLLGFAFFGVLFAARITNNFKIPIEDAFSELISKKQSCGNSVGAKG